MQLFGRLHFDLFNVSLFLLPGVRLQIRLKKERKSFYMMNKAVDSKTTFKFVDAQFLFGRIRPQPFILIAHNSTLNIVGLARYYLTSDESKTFTFSTG